MRTAFSVESSSPQYIGTGDHPLYLIIDGDRVGDALTGAGLGEFFDSNVVGPNKVDELFSINLEMSLMRRIIHARSVEGKLVEREFSLSPAQIRTMADFAERINLK